MWSTRTRIHKEEKSAKDEEVRNGKGVSDAVLSCRWDYVHPETQKRKAVVVNYDHGR